MWSGGRGGEGERRNVAFAHLLCQSLSLHELDSIKHFIAYKTRLMVQTCDKYVTPITLIPIYIQQDATLHSLFISGNCSTCFGRYPHPSSGAHTTVYTSSDICQIVTATCRYSCR